MLQILSVLMLFSLCFWKYWKHFYLCLLHSSLYALTIFFFVTSVDLDLDSYLPIHFTSKRWNTSYKLTYRKKKSKSQLFKNYSFYSCFFFTITITMNNGILLGTINHEYWLYSSDLVVNGFFFLTLITMIYDSKEIMQFEYQSYYTISWHGKKFVS